MLLRKENDLCCAWKNAILVLQDILRKYSKPDALVFNPYLSTGATPRACLLEHKHPKFIDCSKEKGCIREMKPSSNYVFASQALNPDSDINEEESVCSSVRTFLTCSRQHSRKQVQVRWRPDQRLRPVQVFADHITILS